MTSSHKFLRSHILNIAKVLVPLKDRILSRTVLDNLVRLQSTGTCQFCDLTGAPMNGLNLSGLDLRYANLSGANLSGTILSRTSLTNANLMKANLTDAKLIKAKLNRAI